MDRPQTTSPYFVLLSNVIKREYSQAGQRINKFIYLKVDPGHRYDLDFNIAFFVTTGKENHNLH